MVENIQDIGRVLVGISWGVTILALAAAATLYIRGQKTGKKFRQIKEEDFKTILSLMKEKEGLMEEKEALRGEILQTLNSLSQKESTDQGLLMEMVKKYEENESERREDLMNWLEFKAKKWQDQLEASMTNRLGNIQIEISRLNKRTSKLEKLSGIEEENPTPNVELA